jgi:dipeptidase E
VRLFLASSSPATPAPELVDLVGAGARVAVVANAQDGAGGGARRRVLDEEHRLLDRLGFSSFELDLRRHFRRRGRLAGALAQADLLWVTGGNVFILRDALGRSGLDRLLAPRLAEDSLAYAGFSAGACVCGPSLRGLELADELPRRRKPRWDGLGLVTFSVVPHYRSGTDVAREIEAVVGFLRARGMSYRALRDGEALVIRDGSMRTVQA